MITQDHMQDVWGGSTSDQCKLQLLLQSFDIMFSEGADGRSIWIGKDGGKVEGDANPSIEFKFDEQGDFVKAVMHKN